MCGSPEYRMKTAYLDIGGLPLRLVATDARRYKNKATSSPHRIETYVATGDTLALLTFVAS